MKTNFAVIKRIAKRLEILQYIQELQSYQVRVFFEHADNSSIQTFVLPEQYLYPYTVVSMDLSKTQPIQKEVPVQDITIIGNKQQSSSDNAPSICEESKSQPIKPKKQLDFDSFANQPSTLQYVQNLKREVMTVRVKRGRKKLKP